MNKVFTDNGWKDYVYWQTEDRKTLKKINSLIEDICRNGNEGIGKPEPLTGNLTGFWSRRINDKDRIIYKIDDTNVYILACKYHYNLYLLPTSIHECMVLLDRDSLEYETLLDIVRQSNKTLEREDVLSDNIYYMTGEGENFMAYFSCGNSNYFI